MSPLEHTQQKFYQAIFDKKISLEFIASKNSRDRLAIYRANIFENLRHRLANTFPGIWILLGEECANSVALAFIKNPEHQRKEFPDFLTHQSELAHLPYLKDYARYEWLGHKAYYAANALPINPYDLEKIPEKNLEKICFKFLPSVFLYTSPFSIEQIKTIIDNPDASAINLKQENTTAVIARPEEHVLTVFINPDMSLFFTYLYQGQTLGQACEQINVHYPDFDLTQAIHLLLKHKLIMEIL
jgi:hypothetical protein